MSAGCHGSGSRGGTAASACQGGAGQATSWCALLQSPAVTARNYYARESLSVGALDELQ